MKNAQIWLLLVTTVAFVAMAAIAMGTAANLSTAEREAAIGRKLCASVRAGVHRDLEDLERTDRAEMRARAADSLLGSRVPDGADLVELCTPLPPADRFADCRAARDYACLAEYARALDTALSRYEYNP